MCTTHPSLWTVYTRLRVVLWATSIAARSSVSRRTLITSAPTAATTTATATGTLHNNIDNELIDTELIFNNCM